MTLRAKEILGVVNSLRDEKCAHSLVSLVKRCKDSGITMGAPEVAFLMTRTRRGGDHFVPTDVAEFIGRLIERSSPNTLLDP